MTRTNFLHTRIYFTSLVMLGMLATLLWDYWHGGVPSHHLLARKDMPSFSNWWGALVIPGFTWFALYRLQQRAVKAGSTVLFSKTVRNGFIGALIFGILLAVIFSLNIREVPGYMLMSTFVLALFIPIYRIEYWLGFVLAITYTFGGVLPIIIGAVLCSIAALIHLGVRPLVLYLKKLVVNN